MSRHRCKFTDMKTPNSQHLIKCAACGSVFKVKPSRTDAAYCSMKCKGIGMRKPDNQKICAECGVTFETTWRNRKVLCCSKECGHRYQGKGQKARGHTPIKFRNESKWRESVQCEKNRIRARQARLGKPMQSGKTKRFSSKHFRAVECFLRSPKNVVFYVCNVNRFVHMNPSLFPKETLNYRKNKATLDCAATVGLRKIICGQRTTWRGWQLVSRREGRERFDLLGRNWEEHGGGAPPAPL